MDSQQQDSTSPLVRVYAAVPHIGVIISAPLLLLSPSIYSIINIISGINPNCAFKPFPGCGVTNRSLMLVINVAALLILWSLPFISPFIIVTVLKIWKNLHPFIRRNAETAAKFQFKLARRAAILHISFMLVLVALSGFSVGGMAGMFLLTLMADLFFLLIFVVIELFVGMAAAIFALRGRIMKYPEVRRSNSV